MKSFFITSVLCSEKFSILSQDLEKAVINDYCIKSKINLKIRSLFYLFCCGLYIIFSHLVDCFFVLVREIEMIPCIKIFWFHFSSSPSKIFSIRTFRLLSLKLIYFRTGLESIKRPKQIGPSLVSYFKKTKRILSSNFAHLA